MNNQRPYAQPMARPSNQAGPTIRAGLSVQELKAMTAMRVAHDDSPSLGVNPRDVANAGPYRNPASSYQTATPQQLQAAGIAPVVINERPAVRQPKTASQGPYASYASSSAYGEQDLVGQSRPYSYDGPATSANTSSYAKASSTAGVTPALSAYHQQILPNRNSGPVINSVEDVKEMTRLRMLMAERDAFFESSASGRNGNGNGPTNPEQNNGSHSSGGPHSDFDGPGFEDLQAPSRFAVRSTDSFDSYDYPGVGVGVSVEASRASARGLQASHAQSPLVGGLSGALSQQTKSLYAPPSQQHQLYEYGGSNPGSAGSSSKMSQMSQSSSVGGLGLGLSSPLGGPLASPSSYGPQSGLRPNVGGSRSQVSLGLGLAGSNVVGRRAVGAPLAPVDRFNGYPVERGIERNLLLNAQLTGHSHAQGHHGLGLGLSGSSSIDRVEQSLNGLHGHGHYQEDLLPPASSYQGHQSHHGLSAGSSARLTSGGGSGLGLSPTTHSSRSSSNSYMSSNQSNNNNNNNNNNNQSGNSSFHYGSNNSSGRDVSLSALLLGENNHLSHSHPHSNNNHSSHGNSAYSQFGADPHTPHTPLDLDLDLTERDTANLYDLLSDPLGTRMSNAASNTSNILSTLNSLTGHGHSSALHTSNNNNNSNATVSSLRLELTTYPQKVLLGPLSVASSSVSSPSVSSTTAVSTPMPVPSIESRVSPRTMLAPLQESPTSSTSGTSSSHKELPHTLSAKELPPGAAVRKLSLVGKAATYNDAVSGSLKDKKEKEKERGVIVLPELETSPTKLKPSVARSAFTEHTSGSNNNNHSNSSTSTSSNSSCSDYALGIASPENSESKRAPLGANTSSSPTPGSSGSASNKRFPLIKASTTSRIPSDNNASPGVKSPSQKMMFARGSSNNKNYDYTPPGTALDRAASDSNNMNFLASEMAEMVLDTPHKPGFGPTHSRDNSSDLSRLLAAINNSGSDVGDNSLPSVTSKSFKRIPSISGFLGFD